ncbi:MAG: arginine--tRNA ligase [Spirochaetes bacterium]|nr:arginine--tRNA ligase [Spirochaetota bacterium]
MYSLVEIKDLLSIVIKNILFEEFSLEITEEEIYNLIEYPENPQNGDISLPLFQFSKLLKKNPIDLSQVLINKLNNNNIIKTHKYFDKIFFLSGYLNFFINKIVFENLFNNFIKNGFTIKITPFFKDFKLVMDYSSPNIAKPFGIGHLISTSLGEAIKRVYQELGAKVIGINYLGDWGTQFGKLIYSIKEWTNLSDFENNKLNIYDLFNLYVKYHKEEEIHPEITEKAREIFLKLEQGDEEYLKIWEKIKNISLKEFHDIYKLLNIDFDFIEGESKYKEKDLKKILNILEINKILNLSEGAKVVYLNEVYNDKEMPPAIIVRSNGTSTYLLRDISALLDRWERFHFDRILYIVGVTQELHFKQVFGVIKKLNFPFKNRTFHVSFGTMRFLGQKMATREGNIIFLKDVFDKIYEKAYNLTIEKGISKNPEDTAKKISIGALNFSILKNSRTKDIDFNFDKVLSFEGDSSIYIQYTISRLNSILKNFFCKYQIDEFNQIKLNNNNGNLFKKELLYFIKKENIDLNETVKSVVNFIISNELFNSILKETLKFEDIILSAGKIYEPYIITRFTLKLCSLINTLYNKERIINEDKNESFIKIIIIYYINGILKKCIKLLNIPEIESL